MEPIRGPVWDDPVPKEPYKLKDPPRVTVSDGNSMQDPCNTVTKKTSTEEGDGPPPEWTRRGRRNAVWEIDLETALAIPTACYDTQAEDLDPEYFKIQRGHPVYIPEHRPGRLPAVGEVAERYQVINDTCYRVCLCTRRNGLQDTCPLTGCGGKPPCLTTPRPSCEPSGFAPPSKANSNYYKDVEFILCPAQTNQSKSACPRKPSLSAPVTKDYSYASYCNSRSANTY